MTGNKRLGVSVFLVILNIFLAISIIFTFSISYMFSNSGVSGKLFGKYIYIMETADMKPEIEKGAAVIADKDSISVLVEGNVVLFKNGSREDVMRIRQVIHNTDKTVYQVSPDKSPQNLIEVSKDNIIAKCITEGKNLGSFISFLSSIAGIIIFMILPCIAILGMLIGRILLMKKNEKEGVFESQDEFEDDDDDDDEEFSGFNGKQVKSMPTSPLFNPEEDINPGEDFEKKKSSIYQNFKRKPGAQTKKMPRKKTDPTPKAAVEKFKAAVEEKPNAPVSKKPSLIPTNKNPAREEKLSAVKEALINQDRKNNPYSNDDNVSEDKTVAFRAVDPKKPYPDRNRAKAPSAMDTEQKKTASKSDNINSIDDLIKALEEEKKKL